MKQNKLLIFLALFMIVTAYSQNSSGYAFYKVNNNVGLKFNSKESPQNIKEKINSQFEKSNSSNYVLEFNDNSSLYKEEEILEIGEKLLETISSSSIGKLYKSGNIYINEVEFLGKRFLINGELENLKWSIDRTKTKEVLGYSCVKATTKVIRVVEDKTYDDIIECFYAEHINTSQGPDFLHGLNGLILEANIGIKTITCYKLGLINFNEIKLKPPTKGEKVSKQEYDLIVKNKMQERIKNKY